MTYTKGSLRDLSDPTLKNAANVPISINFGTTSVLYTAGQNMASQTLSFAITDGNAVSYPFDDFVSEFTMSASAPTSPDTRASVPVVVR
jgi:hypothetical protein